MGFDYRGVPISQPAQVSAPVATKPAKRQPTADEQAEAQAQANSDGTVANWDSSSGTFSYRPMTSGEQIERNQQKDAHPEWFGQDPASNDPAAPQVNDALVNQALDQMDNPVTNPALTRNATQQRGGFGPNAFGDFNPFGTTPNSTKIATSRDLTFNQDDPNAASRADIGKAFGTDGGTAGAPGAEAPTVNRQKIDDLLGGLSGYQNKIADLAEDNTGLSVAEAQLKKSTDLANLQAGIDTEASQRGALGQARSSRSRADRGLLERQAVGESAFVGQEAARTASLRQAEQQGNLAELRAQEADYDRRFRLEALGKAADLGLNRSALEVDISKTNLDSATNWINQQFGQLGIDKNINQEQAQSLLGYTRDMAAIQLQYDQLNSQEQQQADALLMQKYGIDQQTMVSMKEIKEKGKFHWDQVLAGVAGGVGTAATAGAAKALGIGS